MTIHRAIPHASGARTAGIRRRAAAAVVATAALALTACSGPVGAAAGAASGAAASGTAAADQWATTTTPAKGALDNVNWNLLLEPSRLDPAMTFNYGDSEVVANLCESLQLLKPDFTIAPGLATLTPNADHTELTLAIEPKATFWDGQPVTADDVAFSLTRVWQNKEGSPWQPYFTAVKAVQATDAHTVKVTLSQGDLLFERILATSA